MQKTYDIYIYYQILVHFQNVKKMYVRGEIVRKSATFEMQMQRLWSKQCNNLRLTSQLCIQQQSDLICFSVFSWKKSTSSSWIRTNKGAWMHYCSTLVCTEQSKQFLLRTISFTLLSLWLNYFHGPAEIVNLNSLFRTSPLHAALITWGFSRAGDSFSWNPF